jgi:hypothetical protein
MDMSGLQQLVLPLDMLGLQQPVLPLDMSGLQQPVLPLDMSGLQQPVLPLDVPALYYFFRFMFFHIPVLSSSFIYSRMSIVFLHALA